MVAAGCGRVAFDATTDGRTGASDSALADDAPTDASLGAWGPPVSVVLPGTSSPDDPSMTEDHLELFFNDGQAIYFATRATPTSPWSSPMVAAGLPTTAYSPHISPDGLTIWFATVTITIATATRATRTSPWGAVTTIAELDSGATDDGPCVTPDQLTIVFDSDRAGGEGGKDIYISTRTSTTDPWPTPVGIAEVNTSEMEERPMISADRLRLYFQANGPAGSHDLWVATRTDSTQPFGAPQPLVDLSTPMYDEDPWESLDGRVLMWGGVDDLKEARR